MKQAEHDDDMNNRRLALRDNELTIDCLVPPPSCFQLDWIL